MTPGPTLPDMEPSQIVGDGVEHRLTFHDGTTRRIFVTDIETPFPEGKLIVSRTDVRLTISPLRTLGITVA